ncbi:MAG: GNAT family N-acetyltransferase [Candidatus Latescibacterota bacterium]
MSTPELAAVPPQQLSMLARPQADHLPPVELPAGYELRAYRPGDEAGWARVLRLAGFREWSAAQCREYLQEPTRRRGSHLATYRNRPVAVTFATPHPQERGVGLLDYVATHPDHRDRHLGLAVCTAVMRFFLADGRPLVRLLTDDWRLPAIRLYLNLGFAPVMTRIDMPARWEAIYAQLGR